MENMGMPDFDKAREKSLENTSRIFLMEWVLEGNYWSIVDYFPKSSYLFAVGCYKYSYNPAIILVYNGVIMAWKKELDFKPQLTWDDIDFLQNLSNKNFEENHFTNELEKLRQKEFIIYKGRIHELVSVSITELGQEVIR